MKQIKRKNKIIIAIASLLFVTAGALAYFVREQTAPVTSNTSKFEIKDRVVKVYEGYEKSGGDLIMEVADGNVTKHQENPVNTNTDNVLIHFNINFDTNIDEKVEYEKRVVFYQECVNDDDGGYEINKSQHNTISSCNEYIPSLDNNNNVTLGGYNVVVRAKNPEAITNFAPTFVVEYQVKQANGPWETISKDKVGG